MSLQYNDTTNFRGILQIFEREIGAERGFISGNTNRLKEFTADVNLAWDSYLSIALPASGTWQYDDSNHPKYPIIKANLVSGQRDYPFTVDEAGNLILDIYKVAILPSATDTLFQEIYPVDVQSGDAADILAENTTTGAPYRYDKTANGIFLDPVPSYNATNGLKVYINREPSYFTHTDTTKKPGCPGIHHRYFALKPALDHARRNSLSVTNALYNELAVLEKAIEEHFSKRSRDERDVLQGEPIMYL